jgi:hypothetical protein
VHVSVYGIYLIDDDLADGSIDSWLAGVVADVEDYLGKHAAFSAFLDDDE